MSRCCAIYAGTSQFAKLASIIGGAPLLTAAGLIDRKAALDAVLAELDRHGSEYSSLDAAFGYQWAYRMLRGNAGLGKRQRILEKALALDPDNEAYRLQLALANFLAGKATEGEALLRSIFEGDIGRSPNLPTPSMRLAASKKFGKMYASIQLPDAATKELPYAALYSAQYYAVRGDTNTASKFAQMAVGIEQATGFIREIQAKCRKANEGDTATGHKIGTD